MYIKRMNLPLSLHAHSTVMPGKNYMCLPLSVQGKAGNFRPWLITLFQLRLEHSHSYLFHL
jgi:hypothetical protein